ncbi:MAG: nuclear transport factor 2 family protein [Acidobacteria bacterium]|nr:nuclear transport factor 2 family protein [Acidobacteriota bacterium]
MRRIVLVAVLAAALGAACSQSAETPFGQQDAARIRQRTQEFAQAFNAKDMRKLLSIYSGETAFMPPNAPTLRGRDAVGDFYKGMFDEGAGELSLESKDVGGHGQLAFESGTFSLTRRPPSGPETRDRGKYLFIWRFNRAQNAWLIDYTIWSSDLPERVEISSD